MPDQEAHQSGPPLHRAAAARRAIEKALSSKRLRDPGKLAKNIWGKTRGKPRSGSDSNASRRTRGY